MLLMDRSGDMVAAVDLNGLAGNPPGFVGREKSSQVPDVAREAESTDWNGGDDLSRAGVARSRFGAVESGVNDAHRQRIDGDPFFRHVAR